MLKHAKAISANTDLLSAQAFTFSKENPENPQEPFLLIAVIIASGEDVFVKIRQLSGDLYNTFFDSELDIHSRMANVFTFLQEQLKDAKELGALIAFIKDGTVYVEKIGQQGAYLYRNKKLTELTQGVPDQQMISGFLNPYDKLLFLSQKFSDNEDLKWHDSLIASLIKSTIENLSSEVEMLEQSEVENPKPLAAVLIENEVEIEDNSAIYKDQTRSAFSESTLNKFSVVKKNILFSKKIIISFALVLLLLGSVGGGLFYFNQKRELESAKVASLLESAQQKYIQSQNEKESNPEQSALLLEEAKVTISEVLKIDNQNKEAKTLQQDIENNTGGIFKPSEISEWPVFLSLDLIKDNYEASLVSLSLGKILMLDTTHTSLVSLDLERKNPQILAGSEQLGKARFSSLSGDTAVIYSEDKGVVRADLNTGKVSVVIKPDSEWGSIADIHIFGGNIYLLDGGKNQIWKYIPVETGYTDKNEYIKSSGVDLGGAKRLLIDYSVWAIKDTDIVKFTGGDKDFFSIGGLDKPISEISAFFASDTADNIYILENGEGRLIILKKDGTFITQYTGEKFKSATDFVVDEKNKKLYLLEGGKIYQIGIK